METKQWRSYAEVGQEFLEKMTSGGLSLEESSKLVDELERARWRERWPKKNPVQYDDPHAQDLADRWHDLSWTASAEQKDAVGLTYLRFLCDLDDATIEHYLRGGWVTDDVGMRISHHPLNQDTRAFWQAVAVILPEACRAGDREFLATDGPMAITSFLCKLDILGTRESPVLDKISITWAAYK